MNNFQKSFLNEKLYFKGVETSIPFKKQFFFEESSPFAGSTCLCVGQGELSSPGQQPHVHGEHWDQ